MTTTPTLSDLIAQKDLLERQIRDDRASAKGAAVAEVRKLMAEHGLTAADVISPMATALGGDRPRRPVAPKYRDPATHATWSGRGLQPKWLAAAIASGTSLADFAI